MALGTAMRTIRPTGGPSLQATCQMARLRPADWPWRSTWPGKRPRQVRRQGPGPVNPCRRWSEALSTGDQL